MTETGKQEARSHRMYAVPDQQLHERFAFRTIRKEESSQAARIEMICFPPNEACSKEMIVSRIERVPELFLVVEDRGTGELAGFLSGLATNESVFRDDFFSDAGLYDPNGTNIMLLGLDVLPDYRGQGLARELMYEYLRRECKKGTRSVRLTCLPAKIEMYKKMGFYDEGVSQSTWGGEKWHEMSCVLNGPVIGQ